MNVFRKSREKLIQEGLLVVNDGRINLYDLNGNWCRTFLREPDDYFGKECEIVSDTENPIAHFWAKFKGKGTVSKWEICIHPEWYEVNK